MSSAIHKCLRIVAFKCLNTADVLTNHLTLFSIKTCHSLRDCICNSCEYPSNRCLSDNCGVQSGVGQYYNKSQISPNKCLQYHTYFSFTILLQRQYLSHCAILIASNNNIAYCCILSRLYG